jgi:uncharacterized protein (TIGR03435 family)
MRRFKLSLEHETKVLPVYVLTAAKSGPKLQPARDHATDAREDRRENASGVVHLDSATMKHFCEALSRRLDRIVVDETGIDGAYAFDLNYEGGRDRSGVAIFSAIQKELGLKLTPGHRPVETLLVKRGVM